MHSPSVIPSVAAPRARASLGLADGAEPAWSILAVPDPNPMAVAYAACAALQAPLAAGGAAAEAHDVFVAGGLDSRWTARRTDWRCRVPAPTVTAAVGGVGGVCEGLSWAPGRAGFYWSAMAALAPSAGSAGGGALVLFGGVSVSLPNDTVTAQARRPASRQRLLRM